MFLEALELVRKEKISEAFSKKNIERAAQLVVELIEKYGNFGKFRPFSFWYHNEFISEGQKGVGFLFISDKGYLIRVSYIQPKTKAKTLQGKYIFNRIDFWVPGKSKFDQPTKTILIEPWVNSIDVIKDVLRELTGSGIFAENVNEEKIRAPKKLIAYAQYKGLEYDGETAYTLIKKLKEQGLWDEEEYRGFKVARGKKERNTITNDLENAEQQFKKKKYADPDIVFEDIKKLTKVVALGLQNSLIVAGMPGLGKTYEVKATLTELLGQPNKPDSKWAYYQGLKASPLGLYRILFENRHDKVIVFDDSDSVWKDPDSVNMLKAALDTTNPREISWVSKNTINIDLLPEEEREGYLEQLDLALRDPEQVMQVGYKLKLPTRFEFTSRVIFISNLPAEKIDSAIRSRSLFIDLQLSREGVIQRIKSIIPYIHPEVPMEIKEKIVDKLAEGNQPLTTRAVVAGIAIFQAGIDDWERLVREYT